MDVFDLQARIGLDTSDYEKGVLSVRDGFGTLKSAVKDAVSGIYSASSAAAEVLSAVFGASADSSGAFTQLKNTFAETFARDMPAVIKNTEQAFASAGDSAGKYLEGLTALSGSMLHELGSDAEKAADTAGSALKSISDSASGLGEKISQDISENRGFENVLAGYRELYGKLSSLNAQFGREAESIKSNAGAYAVHSAAVRALSGEYENAAGSCRDIENAFSALDSTFRRYAGSGSAVVSENADKISRANEDMLESFRNAGNETARSFETQKNIFSGGYDLILEAVRQGGSDIAAGELAAKRELRRQAAAELEKYRQLHGSEARKSSRAFADGLSHFSGKALQNAAALADAGVRGLRSKLGDFAAAGSDSGTAYGNSLITAARSAVSSLLSSGTGADTAYTAGAVKMTDIPLRSIKTASGGVFDRPAVRLIGEDGPEAVVPLEKNTGWIDRVADRVAEAIGGVKADNGDFTVIMENVNIYNTDDIDALNYELEMSRRRTIAAMGG